ncbi:MAG TPA: polysaccharide biosynthesis/export family protein [Longimicrobiales bacterium]
MPSIRTSILAPFLALAAAVPPPLAAQSTVADTTATATAQQLEALRPGDVVQLRIWREEDLSGEFPIAADGTVVLPKIGVWKATGVPPDSLEAAIIEAFRRYLRNPSIQVVFLRRVNIMGSVRLPGLYPVDPTMAIADVLALAGGVTPVGKQDEIELRRGGEVLVADITEQTRIGDLPIRSGDQLFVPERSWISRNQGLVAVIISSITTLAATYLSHELSK